MFEAVDVESWWYSDVGRVMLRTVEDACATIVVAPQEVACRYLPAVRRLLESDNPIVEWHRSFDWCVEMRCDHAVRYRIVGLCASGNKPANKSERRIEGRHNERQ